MIFRLVDNFLTKCKWTSYQQGIMALKESAGDDLIHNYSGRTIRFEIKYKNRTIIAILIDSYGNVEVQAPKGTPDKRVLQLLEGKWDPIQQKLKEMKDRLYRPQEKVYEHGESFLYLAPPIPYRFFKIKILSRTM